MHTYEWIAAGYFAIIGTSALAVPMARARAARVLVTAGFLVSIIALLAIAPQSPVVIAVRTWGPAFYVLVGYWLPAKLCRPPNTAVERWLLDGDRRLDGWLDTEWLVARAPRAILEYLELSYLLTYIFLPGGLAVLMLAGRADLTSHFWAVGLVAHLTAFATLVLIQTRPPWSLEAPRAIDRRGLLMRRLNLFIVRYGSNRINTLPSGHASGAFGVALVVCEADAAWGSVLLFLAASIAVAAYVGRYHYAADVWSGLLVAMGVWLMALAVGVS